MNAPSSLLAATMARVTAAINSSWTLEKTLDSIVQAATHTVPGSYHVGISVTLGDGTIETRASTDQIVRDLDALQYDLREGPSYDAVHGETITVVNHAGQDPRWPTYLPEAATLGVRSQLGLGLYNNEEPLGGLSLYSTESDTVANEAVLAAQMFAALATTALGRAREVGHLQESLFTRRLVGQAVGILMERHRLDDEHALQYLTGAAEQGNNTLRSAAEDLVERANAICRDGEVVEGRDVPPTFRTVG